MITIDETGFRITHEGKLMLDANIMNFMLYCASIEYRPKPGENFTPFDAPNLTYTLQDDNSWTVADNR